VGWPSYSGWYSRMRPRWTIQSFPWIGFQRKAAASVSRALVRSCMLGLGGSRSTAIPGYWEGLNRSGLAKSRSRVTRHLSSWRQVSMRLASVAESFVGHGGHIVSCLAEYFCPTPAQVFVEFEFHGVASRGMSTTRSLATSAA